MSESEVFNKLPLWEQTQYKAFRNWVNINLNSVKESVQTLESDFKNGTKLAHLTEILQKKSIGKWNKETKRQMQELENLNIAITAIQKDGVKLVNIGSTDINQGNLKIILGLIWTLIQHYHISQLDLLDLDVNEGDSEKKPEEKKKEEKKNFNAKDKLLLIINIIIKPWGYEAKNFTTDFQNGKILQCLAHTREPNIVRDPHLLGDDKVANVKEVLEGLDKFNIPRVMDVEDITEQHDEKSMMTLLGYVLKEVAARKQVSFGPGHKQEQSKQVEQPKKTETKVPQQEDDELLEESNIVHSSKKDTGVQTNTTDLSDLPKINVDRKSLFTRFVEIGRVVLITYGEYEGRIAAILDVIDANSVIVAGPTSGVPRHPISLRRVQLTDIVIPFRHNPRQKTLEKVWNEKKVQQVWENSSWGKKLASRKRKAELNDFDRFKVVVSHQQRSKLIRKKRRELVPTNKKSKN